MVRSFWARRARLRRQLRRRQGFQGFTPQISCTCEHLEDRTLLSSAADLDLHVHAIFAPDAPREYVNSHTDTPSVGPPAFQLNPRWSSTATNGSGLQQGDPTILTWSIVPDGTAIPSAPGINEPAAPSNLIAYLGGIYGVTTADTNYTDEAWFPLVQSIYDRWSELSGITFVYEEVDDGATLGSGAPGVLNMRGDMRLSGHFIDGNSGTLAYNFYPDTGDMVIDTGDNFFVDTGSNSIKLRNMLAHEVGHGIGIRHLDSSNASFLMEPFINPAFDGPQFDDILSAHRWYGDHLEDTNGGNDSAANAHDLGVVPPSGSLTIGSEGDTPSVAVADIDFVSIDDDSDVDYYSFTLTSATVIDVTLSPVGPTYSEGAQDGTQTPLNAAALGNLVLELVDGDGVTVLASRNAAGLGGAELIDNIALAVGTYYVRVSGTTNEVQMYRLAVQPPSGTDDHGNTAGTATLISVPSITPGNIEAGGDVDYLVFNAFAGADYLFETTLTTLPDSTLTLYGTDGVTQLAFDDDGGTGLASLIGWTAPADGMYYLKVEGISTSEIGTYSLAASVSGLPIALVGIDFGSGGSSPNNWTSFGTIGSDTLDNLIDENGTVTEIDAVITFGGNGYWTFAPQAAHLPIHSQSLAGLDGNLYGSGTATNITFQGLTPGQVYEIYVFGGDTDIGGTSTQLVTITGETMTTFSYSYTDNQLYVNSTLGSNVLPLEDFAETMVANGSGEISITIERTGTSTFYGLAGLAIRLVETMESGPFIVDTTADTVDVNPGDGLAEDASGNTSLRAAIMEANALAGANEIQVPAGTYTLSIGGTLEDGAATGDLDITDDLTITGAGGELTIINGGSIDRVLHVLGGTSGNPVELTLQDLTITGGRAFGSDSAQFQDRGAGMFVNFNSQVTVDRVVFRNNQAPRTGSSTVHGIGGAIANSGNLTVLDSRFENNLATNDGGAIYMGASGASATILRTTFENNVSPGGGAIRTSNNLVIEDSLFVGNNQGSSGQGNGGAINVQSGAIVRITNSTLSGNSSVFGGAIHSFGTVIINGSTITGNSADGGGGINTSGSLTIANSIVAGNTASIDGPDIDGGIMSDGHNLIGDTTDAAGFHADDLLNVDPMLGPLADNGGPTLTHALQSGSPAIDAANTATAPATDQRGVSRPQGAEADIGAFEAIPTTAFVVNTTADTVDANPGDGIAEDASGNTSLRAAIMEANALAGANEILVPAGTYTLSIAGIWEATGATGDLDIMDELIITGDGQGQTIINGAGIDRVFDIAANVNVQFHDLTIIGGQAIGDSSHVLEDRGGGIRIDFFADVLLAGVTLSGNSAPRTDGGSNFGVGGAIENVGTLTIVDSRFENNMASNSGGAIYSTTSVAEVSIERTTFDGNAAPRGGAIFNDAILNIDASTFSGNNDNGSGAGNGGAINNNLQGTLSVTNSTFSGNDSNIGGAILNAGSLTIQSSTITGNSAGSGGGIANSGSTFDIENSIVAGNTATFFGPDVDGDINSLGHNLIGNTTDNTGFGATGDLLNVDPMLGPLGDHGGPTQTHVPLAGSPVINAANTATAPATDQRGIARPQTGQSDIGAVERLTTPFTFIVDTLDDESDGDFSPGDLSLREAIELSNAYETYDNIQFDPTLAGGTITLSGTQMAIADGVTISGLGRDSLSIDAGGLSRIFEILTGTTGIVSIDGLTLSGGLATGAFPDSYGGAILQRSGNLTLTNARFTNNQADSRGGALFAFAGQVMIDNVEFTNNHVTGSGGGGAFYFQGGHAVVSNSQFSGNTALSGSGGAIENIKTLTVTGSSFTGNMADNGGAIESSNTGILTIEDSTFTGNTARYGGALRVNGNAGTGSIVTILRSTIAGNTATNSGGALQILGADLVIGHTTISANTSGTYGGGIYNAPISSQTTTIYNSTISENSTGFHGGGIYNAAPLVVRNSTITLNRAGSNGTGTGRGGAIYTILTANAPTSTLLHNTIAAGNIAGTGDGSPDEFGKLGGIAGEININPASSHNLIGDAGTSNGLTDGSNGNIVGIAGTGTIPLAVILNPTLADNGGPTLTHALVGNSPALDAGDNAQATDNNGTPLTSDQRQTPFGRILDADGDATATVDIGAYEATLSSQMLLVDTLSDVSDGNFGPGELSLREAIELANLSVGADTIEFAASLANGTITLNGSELLITDDVTINGLGSTLLTISGNDASRIFHVDGVSSRPIDVEISGLTLTGGSATGASPDNQGGAIFNEGGNLTLLGSIITASTAQSGGGGIASIADGTLIIEDATISGNTSNLFGGGIRVFGGATFLTNVQLDGNSATSGGGAIHAGGSSASPGQLTLSNVTLTGNMARFGAGMEILSEVTAVLTDSLLSGNQALSTGAGGGLIAQLGADVTIQNTTITNNSAGAGGGLAIIQSDLWLENSTVSDNSANGNVGGGIAFADTTGSTSMTIIGSTISGNTTDVDGGGVYIQDRPHAFINSTISGNSAAGSGGGIEILDAATVVVRSSTITGNRADSNGDATGVGGGISLTSGMGGTPTTTLHNTIVAGNLAGAAGSHAPDDVSSSTANTLNATSSHNLIGNAATSGGLSNGANGNIVGNAGSGTIAIGTILDTTLADNGGPTLTHALVAGSLAIDAGDDAQAIGENSNPLTTDQRGAGFARILDGDGDVTQTVDIGAFEADTLPALMVTIDPASISENGGVATGTVTRNTSTGNELVVTLMSSDTSEATVLMTVTILAGNTSADFTITGVDDLIADGTQIVTITTTAGGFAAGAAMIDVTDNEVPMLSVSIDPASISEDGGVATGTVTRNTPAGVALVVTLMNSDTTEASVPLTVTIPAGEVSATFDITGVDDFIVDGTQTVTVTASADGFVSGMDSVDVTDDDAGPVTFVVDTFSDVVDGDYSSGQFSLREAVLLANASADADTILFHPSLAGGTITLGGTVLELLDDVTIAGLGMTALTIDASNDSSIFSVAMGVTAEITDLTLANGNSLNAVGGGGIRSFGDLTLRRMTIRDSHTSSTSNGGGGGIYVQAGSLLIEDSHIHDNESNFGGGISLGNGATAEILRTLLENNDATSGGGGGLRVISGAQATVSASTFSTNTSLGGFGRGGAIHSYGTLVVSSSTFVGNSGRIGGAVSLGFNEVSTQATITNSTLSGNQSEDTGGGLHVGVGGDLDLVNSTIVGNHSDFDGGGGGGGGIRIGGGSVTMHNTIVAGNLVGLTSSVNDISGNLAAASSHNLVGNALSAGGLVHTVNGNIVGNGGSGTIVLSSILNPTLANNGGPTMTHALAAGSMALDAGSNAAAVDHNGVALTTDQRQGAFARILDGDGDFTPTVDIGAFEADTLPALMVTISSASISENGGTAMGTVTRNTGTSGALVVTLMSSDTGEASVPTMVTILAGQASATFDISGVDDLIADGTQTLTITASAAGFADGTNTLDVTDNEVPTLSVSINMDSISENGGAAIGTVTRNTPTDQALEVTLMSSDPGEASVPMTVTILAGQVSATFDITGVDDALVDGTQPVTIAAGAAGFVDGTDTLDVTDDDNGVSVIATSINGGSINRSGIGQVSLTFSGAVTIASGVDAFTLFHHGTMSDVALTGAVLSGNGTSEITLDVTGITTALADGYYTLELPAANAVNENSTPLEFTVRLLFHKLAGDGNGDGFVNFDDFSGVTTNFNQTVASYALGDTNGDGFINFDDFSPITLNFNNSVGPLELDYGDAPISYGTLLVDEGARHVIAGNSLWLGSDRDSEADAPPGSSADGDDNNGSADDEDGVTIAGGALETETAVNVNVIVAGDGFLNVWLDFNHDADWDDAGEHVVNDLSVSTGTTVILVTAPPGSQGTAIGRFRLTGAKGTGSTGLAVDGEVEDYAITILNASSPAPDTLNARAVSTEGVVTTEGDYLHPTNVTQVSFPEDGGEDSVMMKLRPGAASKPAISDNAVPTLSINFPPVANPFASVGNATHSASGRLLSTEEVFRSFRGILSRIQRF